MPTRGEAVTRMIRQEIISGAFPQGARMNEVSLAGRFGVSRTPIRSALSSLYTEGLLDYAPNCGYIVRRFTGSDVAKVFSVRASLEGLVCRLAAEQGISDAEHGALDRAIRNTAALLRVEKWGGAEVAQWNVLNNQFHDTLYAAARNDYLTTAIRRTRSLPLLSKSEYRLFGSDEIALWFDRAGFQRSHDEHVDIFDAIAGREGVRAESIMREHITRAGRVLAREWDKMAERSMSHSLRLAGRAATASGAASADDGLDPDSSAPPPDTTPPARAMPPISAKAPS
ncbi:GntR family transcriptional regulator [Microvirga makkahensis]|uniref:FCD domain-containing protein n=1 Tax=Microvirga makkahensis TaxID=1128670 RepID=A0A7X3MWE9_9HYPH|nr:GntR family transcriptional regulator [Microvirga makkahensis]MXQ14461.1 FCD domain-containing protein [Microvirga makkahensis]